MPNWKYLVAAGLAIVVIAGMLIYFNPERWLDTQKRLLGNTGKGVTCPESDSTKPYATIISSVEDWAKQTSTDVIAGKNKKTIPINLNDQTWLYVIGKDLEGLDQLIVRTWSYIETQNGCVSYALDDFTYSTYLAPYTPRPVNAIWKPVLIDPVNPAKYPHEISYDCENPGAPVTWTREIRIEVSNCKSEGTTKLPYIYFTAKIP